MGVTLAVFQSSSGAAVLNDKSHIFVSRTATSFCSSFILLGRVPSSWWFITIQFFFELFHHSPTLTSWKCSPSKIVKDNPSSAIILRINEKLNYFSTKRVGWPKTECAPNSKWLRGWIVGAPDQLPPPEPTGAQGLPGPHGWTLGQHSKSWWWGEAG